MINVGIIGCGYWGPKLIRNFYEIANSNLALICDMDNLKLQQIQRQYPNVATTTNFYDLLKDNIDAVVIATPVNSHYELVKEALKQHKHVLVEKPMTASSKEAEELVNLAARQNRILMVGHIYEYHPAVDYLKQLIKSGELGEIYSIDAHRLNLGLFRSDVNVLWDLGPHDLSIVLSLMDKEPIMVSARGSGHLDPNLCDLAYLELIFPGNTSAHIHLSWLDPRKVRQVTIIGSKKMAFYDDVAEAEKIFLYDKRCAYVPPKKDISTAACPPRYHYGDVTIPFITSMEPLKIECSHFLQCIQDGVTPRTDGVAALKVISILEAANQSILVGGQRIELNPVTVARKPIQKEFIDIRC